VQHNIVLGGVLGSRQQQATTRGTICCIYMPHRATVMNVIKTAQQQAVHNNCRPMAHD
jgi:hypothetical protein